MLTCIAEYHQRLELWFESVSLKKKKKERDSSNLIVSTVQIGRTQKSFPCVFCR